MAYGGDAVGRAGESGMALFAWPGIKGERARVTVTGRRSNLLRGLVTEVLEPSPLRTEPSCPYFGPCGGCQWQHIAYEGQLAFKHGILHSQLSRLAGIEDAEGVLRPPIASPRHFNYRNSSHFALDAGGRSLAYYTRDSRTIVPVERCPISNEGINAAIPVVSRWLAEAPGEEFAREQARGIMRVWQVTIRSSEITGHTLVVFHTRSGAGARPRSRPKRGERKSKVPDRPEEGPSLQPEEERTPSIAMVRREVRRAVADLSHGVEDKEQLALTAVEVMDDGTVNALGATRSVGKLAAEAAAEVISGTVLQDLHMREAGAATGPPLGAWLEVVGGRPYWVAPEAFFQVNTQAAELLLEEVLAGLPQRMNIAVDAHAGVGTFALALAGRAGRVVGFEPSHAAVASGRWSAAALHSTNVDFREGRAELLMTKLATAERPEAVIFDPPRAGCHPGLLAEVMKRQVPRIVYVSCDPSTLARDLKILSAEYRLTSARVVDMFPQTFHMECVVVLEKLG
jgi:23S rRNA (uracil1939-C5)-methyltransferase